MSSLPVSDTISNRIWLKNTAGNFRQCFFMFICHRQLFRRSSCATVRSCPCFFQIYSDFTSASFHLQLFPAHFPTFPRPFPLSNSFLSLSLTTLSLRYPHPPLSLLYNFVIAVLLFNFVIAVLDTAISSLYDHGHSQGGTNGTNQHPVFQNFLHQTAALC